MLPGFPAKFRQAIRAIEDDKPFAEIDEIIASDGVLTELVSQRFHCAPYNTSPGFESLPSPLEAIGPEELKKTMMAKVVDILLDEVNQTGFNSRDFLSRARSIFPRNSGAFFSRS